MCIVLDQKRTPRGKISELTGKISLSTQSFLTKHDHTYICVYIHKHIYIYTYILIFIHVQHNALQEKGIHQCTTQELKDIDTAKADQNISSDDYGYWMGLLKPY